MYKGADNFVITMSIKYNNLITLNTRIKTLLDIDQDGVIAALVKLNSNFSKLKNPVLRKLLAGRVTIADACRIAHCDTAVFMNSMKEIGFRIGDDEEERVIQSAQIDFSREPRFVELDARPYLEKDLDPLKDILNLVRKLNKGERLKIINAFEPVPLINLLRDKGYLCHVEAIAGHLFYTWFEKTEASVPELDLAAEVPQSDEQQIFGLALQRIPPEKIKYIDVRFLEMPQPMFRILEGIERLAADEALYVYHKKIPVFLFPELDKRGLSYVINRKSPMEYDLLIYKNERK